MGGFPPRRGSPPPPALPHEGGGGPSPARRQFDLETSGHAEMDGQHLGPVEMDEDVFGAAVQALDLAARQSLGEAIGQGKAQILAALGDVHEATPAHDGLEAQAHGLDLGELGHGRRSQPR